MTRVIAAGLYAIGLAVSSHLTTAAEPDAAAAPAAESQTTERPNILFIYTDDHSYRTIGCYPQSYPWVNTPHIDQLA